jgi:hypothetical protein
MKYFTFFVLCSALLSGCSSNVQLSGHNLSNLDSSVEIDKSAAIKVVSSENGDQLTNKRYIPNIVSALKERGFSNVSAAQTNPDYTFSVNFYTETKVETKKVPVFNNERNMPYTVCHKDTGSNARTCTTHYYYMAPIVSGYNSVATPTNIYTLHFKLTDKQNNPIVDSTNTVIHENCSQWKMYEFLAKDAIARANFNDPVDKSYSVEMQEGYDCQ